MHFRKPLIALFLLLQVGTAQAQNAQDLPQYRSAMPLRDTPRAGSPANFNAPGVSSASTDSARVVPVTCKKPVGKFSWNFDQVEVTALVDQISRLTCKNFIISSDVKGTRKINIVSRTAVDVDQAYQAFLSALQINGLALVEAGKYLKIVNRQDSFKQTIPLYEKRGDLPADEAMVTLLYELHSLSKEVASNLVKQLAGTASQVEPVGDTFLLISDSSANIRRITRILEKVDVAGAANRIHMIDLVYASATDVQSKVSELFDATSSRNSNNPASLLARSNINSASRSGNPSESVQKIIADERTNKLIVVASDKGYERIKEMVDLLDVPASAASAKGQINVYYLKNGDAEKIAATLNGTLTGVQSVNQRSNVNRPVTFGPAPVPDQGTTFEGDIKVQADKDTNSLVIVASPRDYKSLVKVIHQLDKQRTQVYVEAAILDISLSDTRYLDVNAFSGFTFDMPGIGNTFGLAANPGGVNVANGAITALTSLALGGASQLATSAAGISGLINTLSFMGNSVTIPGTNITVPKIGVVLKLLETYSNVDIVSTPSLTTLDNVKAEIAVGEKIPIIKSLSSVGVASAAAGASGIPLQNIDYVDAQTKIEITPHVNDDNVVRLELMQTINDIGDDRDVGGGLGKQPIIRTKSTKTEVRAQDQQTVVIGGLISSQDYLTEDKWPVLGDIPVLGHLFKTHNKKKIRKDLVLILTPYVIRNDEDMRKIYARKEAEREEFAKLYFGRNKRKYDPYVDYDKKTGPLTDLLNAYAMEMKKAENGGPGLPGETLVTPVQPGAKDHYLQATVPELDSAPSNTAPAPDMTIEPEPLPLEPEPEPAPSAPESEQNLSGADAMRAMTQSNSKVAVGTGAM